MKNIKKTLVMCICLVLIAVMAIGGTVAYLTVDPIEKGNVFSVGNIAINLTEAVGTTGAATVTSDNNGATYENVMPGDYLKKEVTVENTGSRPAYVAVEVTINNALEINNAIDEFYEAKGYSEAEIQQIYDYIFEGFGMNYTKKDANGNATGMRLTITDDKMPENVLQVDSVKTISEYWLQYSGNWFMDTDTVIPYDGYYTTGMNDYELRYTYYLLLDAGEKSTLFKGFKVPKEFNAQQLDMFNGLNIDIVASAIQKDNFADAKTAFSTLKNEMVWVVKDAASLAKAIKKGGKIKLADDIALEERVVIPEDVTVQLDLNGNKLSNQGNNAIYSQGDLTIVGDGEISSVSNYAIRVQSGSLVINSNDVDVTSDFGAVSVFNGANVTINGGNFENKGYNGNTSHTIYLGGYGTININGGTFKSGYSNGGIDTICGYGWSNDANQKAIINLNGGTFYPSGLNSSYYFISNYDGSWTEININGGTYHKYNPANIGGTKLGADRVVTDNGDGTYSVGFTKADSNASLEQAIKDGVKVIELPAGDFVIPAAAAGKNLTIIGNGATKVTVQNPGSYEGCDYSLRNSKVTFENIVITTDSHTYAGYADLSATYNNCTFNGTYSLYGDSVFNNCEFNVTGDVYNLWTWGAKNVTLNNCTFNSDGKAVLLYGGTDTKLEVNGCVFNDKGGLTDLKAAIEIGNDYDRSYQLIVNNTVVNGYEINDKGINTGTTLWGNKNSMGTDKLNVIVDGVDVY